MASRVLLDTNVLIDYLRGQKEAITYLDALTEERLISTITVAELYAGLRDGDERDRIDQFIIWFLLTAKWRSKAAFIAGTMVLVMARALRMPL